jgi:hypothetical protein
MSKDSTEKEYLKPRQDETIHHSLGNHNKKKKTATTLQGNKLRTPKV